MIDITVSSLVKSFEIGTNVLDGLSFTVNEGERVGILGHNGCGKSTLFKILVQEIDYDEGIVVTAPGKRIGLITQIPVYPSGWTVNDVLKTAQKRLYDISRRIDILSEKISDPSILAEYDRLLDDFKRLGGYEMDATRNRVANGLNISDVMREQSFESLSGGEKTRVNLARLILEDTDILLLDEPTNHLDLQATQWLEEYILHFRGTVLAISHDRYFLDKVVERCIEISEGKAELYSGNYSFYVEERQRRFEEKLKQYEKDQAKIEQLSRAAEQIHLWAFMGSDKLHKRAFSIEKRIDKLSVSQKPATSKKLTVQFKQREFFGDEVLVAEGLEKSFGERKLFSDLSFTVTGGERIAVIGNNGTGKSTLIKLINGEEIPDKGRFYLGPSIRCACLPQIVTFQNMDRSAYDTMIYECGCSPQESRDRLGSFGFRGEDVFIPVGALSGGERSRLKLCMLMGNEINLLMLDEPTNHLDIASREWMEDALCGYNETLIFVSHDRFFIEKFATRIWSFTNNTVVDFKGGYKAYCEWCDRQKVYTQNDIKKQKSSEKTKVKTIVRRNDKLIAKLEAEIARKEEKMKALDRQYEEFSFDYEKLMKIDEDKAKLGQQLEELYEKWEELSE